MKVTKTIRQLQNGRVKYEPAELHARQAIAVGTNSVTQELAFSISSFKAA